MGLTFRSQSLQDGATPQVSRWWLDIIKGVPFHESPDVRGEDVVAPGRPGRYLGNRVNDVQELLIEGWIRGFGETPDARADDWHANTQLILAVFTMDAAPGTLIATPGSNHYLGLSDDATIDVRTVDQMPGPIASHMAYQTWSFKLECVDGLFWQSESS